MKVAIVEDSCADRKCIAEYIERYAASAYIPVDIFFYKNGETFMDEADITAFDVVFLDIFMGDVNGIQVASYIRGLSSSLMIIFVTSTHAYAVDSYDVGALHYIIKPIAYPKIVQALKRAQENLRTPSRYIEVTYKHNTKRILLSDIIFVDYYNHSVQIHTDTEVIRTYVRFAEIEDALLKYEEFICCFRNIVVNMNKVDKLDGMFFIMRSGECIPIKRKLVKEVNNRYTDYVFKRVETK